MTISNKASSGLSEIQHNGTTFLEADGTDVTIKGNLVVEGSSGIEGCREYFQSADQTITNAGALTIAHGLSGTPISVEAWLKNVTTEAGYTTGQMIPIGFGDHQSARHTSCIPDATNLTIRMPNSPNAYSVGHATTGASTLLTNANWKLVFRAWY